MENRKANYCTRTRSNQQTNHEAGSQAARIILLIRCRLYSRCVGVHVPIGTTLLSFPLHPRRFQGACTQPPIQRVQWALSPKVRRPKRSADHSHPSGSAVKNTWIYTPISPYVLMPQCLISQAQLQHDRQTTCGDSAGSGPKRCEPSPAMLTALTLRSAPHKLRTSELVIAQSPGGERLMPKYTEDKDNGRKWR
jgi:hypothetical protein